MKTITVCLFVILLWAVSMSAQVPGIHRPGTIEAGKAENQAQVPPQYNPRPKPADPAVLKREAEELTKLAAALPDDVERAAKGSVAADLNERLKRIEKLSKHLRRELLY